MPSSPPSPSPAALVACVMCGAQLPAVAADVVGQGHRCPTCTYRAELYRMRGGDDRAAHFTPAERRALALGNRQTTTVGLLLFVLGALVLAIVREPALLLLGMALGVGGVATLIVGAVSGSR